MDQIFPKQKRSKRPKQKEPITKKLRKGCVNGLHSLDIFGEKINLTYKGRDTYTTLPGSLASLFILLTILAFLIYRFYILVNRLNPNLSQIA